MTNLILLELRTVLVFLVVILLLAALLETLSLRGGTARVGVSLGLDRNHTEPDEPVTLDMTVTNGARLPISYLALSVGFPLSATLPAGADVHRDPSLLTLHSVFRLWGRQTLRRSMTFSVGRRGVHAVNARALDRGDFLGLRTETERLSIRKELVVYPRPFAHDALTEAMGSYFGEMSARRWLLRDPVLAMGVREYTGSEPMHTISWNQTARRGELTVREFDYTRSLNCCVLLSVSGLKPEETELLDRCCGAARTVVEALCTEGVEALLCTNAHLSGYGGAPVRSATASAGREKDVLDVLARATFTACSTPSALAEDAMALLSESTAFILIAPHADEESEAALRLLNAKSSLGALLVAVDALGEEGSN